MQSKGDGNKKRNREKIRDLLEREKERRDSGQSKGDGTGDERKREKLAKEKENTMVDCWVFIDGSLPYGDRTLNFSMVETDLFCKAREMVPKTKEIGKS